LGDSKGGLGGGSQSSKKKKKKLRPKRISRRTHGGAKLPSGNGKQSTYQIEKVTVKGGRCVKEKKKQPVDGLSKL